MCVSVCESYTLIDWKVSTSWTASASEPSGLLPLTFCVVISEMHKNLWRFTGWVWFIYCAHSKCPFLVGKFVALIIGAWFQLCRRKCTIRSWWLSHLHCRQNYTISHKKQPRPFADACVNFERLARVRLRQHQVAIVVVIADIFYYDDGTGDDEQNDKEYIDDGHFGDNDIDNVVD